MAQAYQYIELSFINGYEEIKRQIINTVAISFLFDRGFHETSLQSYLESTQYGYTASAEQSGTHRLLRITDIISGEVNWDEVPYCNCENGEKYLLTGGDILVARTGGTTGKSFLINSAPANSIFASYLIRLRTRQDVYPEFISIFLNSYVFWAQISELKSGSAQPNVNAEKLKTLVIPECSPEIQSKVIRVLSNVPIDVSDGFSDILKRNVESALSKLDQLESLKLEFEFQQSSLRKIRHSILQDAVRGQLALQNASDESADRLLLRIHAEKQMLIDAGKLKRDKGLPKITKDEMPFEIAKGWVWCRLGEICIKIGSGSTPRGGREVYKPSGVRFIRSQNVYDEGLVFDNVAYIDEGTHKKMGGTKVLPNDILLNITGGSIGRCSLVPSDFGEGNVSQHVTIIRTVSAINREYIHNIMLSPYFQDYIMATQTGGNREGLAKKNMELMLIPIPPILEQDRIVKKIEQLKDKIQLLDQQVFQNKNMVQVLFQKILNEAFGQNNKVISEGKESKTRLYPHELLEQYFFDMKIIDILRDAKKPVLAGTLWKQSEYSNDIEKFYSELKRLVDIEKVVIEEKIGKDSYLKLVGNAN